MSLLQQYQLWIGFAFATLLIGFLIFAFFKAKTLTPDQRSILKFLSALCAGFAGALITGDALFKMEGSTATAKYAISGTAGAALFFVVWFFFPRVTVLPEGFNASIPQGWTFKDAVDAFAQQDGAVPNYNGFTDLELGATLKAWQLKAKNISDAILLLRSITTQLNAIRKYEVKFESSVYYLNVL